jgi:hypothetical protein
VEGRRGDENWGCVVGAGQYISIFIEQLLYPLILLVDLFRKLEPFISLDALPNVLAWIVRGVVVPND